MANQVVPLSLAQVCSRLVFEYALKVNDGGNQDLSYSDPTKESRFFSLAVNAKNPLQDQWLDTEIA
jgi:hypothetical protein